MSLGLVSSLSPDSQRNERRTEHKNSYISNTGEDMSLGLLSSLPPDSRRNEGRTEHKNSCISNAGENKSPGLLSLLSPDSRCNEGMGKQEISCTNNNGEDKSLGLLSSLSLDSQDSLQPELVEEQWRHISSLANQFQNGAKSLTSLPSLSASRIPVRIRKESVFMAPEKSWRRRSEGSQGQESNVWRKESGVSLSGYNTPRRQSYPDRCVTPSSRSSTPSLPGHSSTPLRTRSTTPSRMDRSSTPLMTRSTTPCLKGRNSAPSLLPRPVTPSLPSQLSRPSTPSRPLSAPSRRGSLLLPPRSSFSTPPTLLYSTSMSRNMCKLCPKLRNGQN